MIDQQIEIRRASRNEAARTVATIVTAFITDPMPRFAYPSPHEYLGGMAQAVPPFAGAAFEHGTAYITTDFLGAALWLPPGVYPDSEGLERVSRESVRAAHLDDLLATFDAMGRCHPDGPHWYLPLIGVDPNAQNRGLGSALMRHVLAHVDEKGSVAYLESANARNVPLYERFGFKVLRDIRIGAAPTVWPMVRQPHPKHSA
jgi:GNAT superfamily N-acetyltransferase